MFLHLLCEVVARLLVGEVEPVLVHQHLLVLEPLLPRYLRHVLEDALAELAGIGRVLEPLGLAPELDALHHPCHVAAPFRRVDHSSANRFRRGRRVGLRPVSPKSSSAADSCTTPSFPSAAPLPPPRQSRAR